MVEGVGGVIGIVKDYPQPALSPQKSPVDGTTVKNKAPEVPPIGGEEVHHEVDKEQVQQAITKMNKTMETYNTELRFQFHEKSGEYVVKLINTKDDSVVREIPPERVLNMVAYFKEMLGLVVDKFA
ncbi:MAG: flagellar protein FlaG [Bacillota bacterium]